MAFKSSLPVKKPKFGGPRKTAVKPPDKKILESFGGARPKQKPFEMNTPGNREFGFIQATPKQATGAFMGRSMPKVPRMGAKTSPRADAKRQFKPRGKKVF